MIYFIQSETGQVKIGFTDGDPLARLASLQTGSHARLELLGAIPGTMAEEKAVHERFAKLRLSGEWFKPNLDLMVWIASRLEKKPVASRKRCHGLDVFCDLIPELDRLWKIAQAKDAPGFCSSKEWWKSGLKDQVSSVLDSYFLFDPDLAGNKNLIMDSFRSGMPECRPVEDEHGGYYGCGCPIMWGL